jgi:hypothetical protein
MLHLFCGDDAKSKILSYQKFLKSIPKGIETFFINRNNFDRSQIESLYSGSGLFFTRCAVVFSGVLEREETRDFLLGKLQLMGDSVSDFVFLESKLKKAELDAFRKPGAKKAQLNVFELPKEKKEKYDNFLVANAFGSKDKLNMWIHFRQAMDRGVGMEELIGVLFWKAKDMMLKKNFGKFKEEELKNFAGKISYLLPQARKSGKDDESAFEQFLLEAF